MAKKEKRGIYPKNFIKELRQLRGWTLRDLEEKTGWSNQTLSNLELSKADLTWSKMLILADVFECHPTDIIDGPPALTDKEKKLLDTYRAMSDREQEIYLNSGKAFVAVDGTRSDDNPKEPAQDKQGNQ